MLKVAAPFPQVGSYGLITDPTLPVEMQRAELARILRHDGQLPDQDGEMRDVVAIALPLRVGATGNKLVALDQVIDATPLTKAEERELADLQRYVAGRERPNKKKAARCEALRSRLIMSGVMAIELQKLGRLQARSQPSTGGYLPREAA